VYGGIDFGVHPDITVGGEISLRIGDGYNIIGFAGNGNYHFNRILSIPAKWDFYAGLSVGYYKLVTDADYNYGGLGWAGQVGGRYYFNEKFGINLELGGGNISGGKIGITMKL